MAEHDRPQDKPYRVYRARAPRRARRDDDLLSDSPLRDPRRDANGRGPRPPRGPSPTPGGARPARDLAPRRRRRLRWWHVPLVLFATVVVAGVVALAVSWPGLTRFDRAVDKANRRLPREAYAQLAPDQGWIWRNGTTVLLLGTDSKAGEPARSDTIMLMRFNPRTHHVNQLSIPRDTRVEIPGRGPDKINEAMFWGGPALALRTVQDYLGIPVNHVMVVDFKGFPRLVNAVGGVDMYVPKTVSTVAGSNRRTVVFKRGWHHFDGKYAMLYVRIRYVDDDFHRAARQQAFVAALQKKLVQPSNLPRLPEIGRRFMSGVATDLTTWEILQLAWLKWRADGGARLVMKGETGYVGGVSYVFPPDDRTRARLVRRFLEY